MAKTMTRPDEVRAPEQAADKTASSALLWSVSDLDAQLDSDPGLPVRRWRRWPS